MFWRAAAGILLLGGGHAAAAATAVGLARLAQADGGTTMVFYPTSEAETPVPQGPFMLSWAPDAVPATHNGRLVVISHGSGGGPWVHADLVRALVARGFVVAVPEHWGDNHLDPSEPGPTSWSRRPEEVSRAIDLVAAHTGLAAGLRLDAVGVFGGSAGGHTVLELAGGQWSPARFRDHCLQHAEEDFSSCVGFITRLHGDGLDGLKLGLARWVIRWRFGDDTLRHHTDPRVRAAVAMVPFAADFVPASLQTPRVPLALILADKDVNQIPRFHGEAVLQACAPRCQLLMRLTDGGHGAMLSPLPPLEPGSVAQQLLDDPPGFDRTRTVPHVQAAITTFFVEHLLAAP